MEYKELAELRAAYAAAADPARAAAMAKYMRNLFVYFGLQKPQRAEIERPILKKWRADAQLDWWGLAQALWGQRERELHYAALNICDFGFKKIGVEMVVERAEWLIVRNSWWDSIDFIAPHLVGPALLGVDTAAKRSICRAWRDSGNIWLQRATIIFQLNYKARTDVEILAENIEFLMHSKDFFIQKAIGWALRQYARVAPDWVRDFVAKKGDKLAPLSRREALKHLK